MFKVRKSTYYLVFLVSCLAMFVAMTLHVRYGQAEAKTGSEYRASLAEKLMITDLCLFTEARYTRNPSMADLDTPFQDHPVSLEHFPSGSFVSPPDFTARLHELIH